MSETAARPSPEFTRAQEDYRITFANVLMSQGLYPTAVAQLARAGRIPMIVSGCNETDGSIELPATIESAILDPYKTIVSPRDDNKPVFVSSVSLGCSIGVIEIETKYNSPVEPFTGYLKIEDNRKAIGQKILFDFIKGKYYFEFINLSEGGGIARVIINGQENIVYFEEHDLTPEMLNAFIEKLPELAAKEESNIILTKNHSSE